MVLVLGLLLVAVLALVGTTAVMTSTTDMKINSNYKTGAQAYYIAEAGIERARAKLPTESATLSDLLYARRGPNNQLSDSAGMASFFADGAFVTDDVPYLAETSFGAGTYRVYLTNAATLSGVSPVEAVTSTTDNDHRVTLTSFGRGPNNSLVVVQVIVKKIVLPPLPAALTLPGPNVAFQGAIASSSYVRGGEKSAIALTSDAAQSSVVNQLTSGGRLANYQCLNPPCINNAAATINPLLNSVEGIEGLYRELLPAAHVVTGSAASPTTLTAEQIGTVANKKIVVVNGNAIVNGISGAGVLIVTGQLTILNNAQYDGVIICIGQGSLLRSGGNSGDIRGAVLVAKTRDGANNPLTTLGNPAYEVEVGGSTNLDYQESAVSLPTGVNRFVKKSWKQFF